MPFLSIFILVGCHACDSLLPRVRYLMPVRHHRKTSFRGVASAGTQVTDCCRADCACPIVKSLCSPIGCSEAKCRPLRFALRSSLLPYTATGQHNRPMSCKFALQWATKIVPLWRFDPRIRVAVRSSRI
jgi:hypothetical protein